MFAMKDNTWRIFFQFSERTKPNYVLVEFIKAKLNVED